MLKAHSRRAAARGLSIIELMVGVAIGLIVVAASVGLSGRNIASSRSLLSDIRLNQDLRAVTDLVTRELRRAAYWDHAIMGTQTTAASAAVAASNPYAAVTLADGTVTYSFTRDAVEDDTLGAGERFGFRLNQGRIEMQTAEDNWQPVTDPGAVSVSTFDIALNTTVLPLGHLCPTTCPVGAPNCPTVSVRRFDLVVSGRSARDPTVQRTLRSSVRVRNDRFGGVCPP